MDVAAWLSALGLKHYEANFRANDIDASLLPGLTATDLRAGRVTHAHTRELRALSMELEEP